MRSQYSTIAVFLEDWATQKPEALAIMLPYEHGVREVTWREFAADVRRVAAAWQHWGLRPGDRVASISRNCYEWILNDFALLMLGGVHVVISEKTPAKLAARQIMETSPRAVLFHDADSWQQISEHCPKLADVTCIAYKGVDPADQQIQMWSSWLQTHNDDLSNWFYPSVNQEVPATIVYSSGTTGEPHGIVFPQCSLLSNAAAIAAAFADEPTGRRLCWLPLSHLYARTADLYCWLVRGSELALVERTEDVLAAAQKTQPEFMNVVPYFLDKLRRHVQTAASTQAERVVLLQELLGGKIRLLISGGAALSDSTRDYYAEHGITAVQGYGLTEAGPVVATETLAQHRRGSVGRPLPGVEVRFTDEGEICVRSPSIMQDNWQFPDLTESKLREGWLHTGDIGRIDDDGFLFVKGRLDDVIVLSTGCKVSPAAIEAALLEESLIQQILVVGQGRKHLAALVVPNSDALRAEIIQRALSVTSREHALVHLEVLELYRSRIAERLQHFAPYEQLRLFTLIGRGWTIESGEMTASLKLKRRLIEQNFAVEIEKLYVGT